MMTPTTSIATRATQGKAKNRTAIRFRFLASEAQRILLVVVVAVVVFGVCALQRCTRQGVCLEGIQNRDESSERAFECIRTVQPRPITKSSELIEEFTLKLLVKLTGYLFGYSISTFSSSDRSSGGCLCAVAVQSETNQRLPLVIKTPLADAVLRDFR
jgi:hypothetical protein